MPSDILCFCFDKLYNVVWTEPYCQNLGLNRGTLRIGWGIPGPTPVPDVTSTKPCTKHEFAAIMTDTNAYDAKTNYKVKKVPTGYRYAARLGDELAKNTSCQFTIYPGSRLNECFFWTY